MKTYLVSQAHDRAATGKTLALVQQTAHVPVAGLALAAALVVTLAAYPQLAPLDGMTPGQAVLQAPPFTAGEAGHEALEAYSRLPLSFVPNTGQTDPQVRYSAQTAGFAVQFTRRDIRLSFAKGRRGAALALGFTGASRNVVLAPRDRLNGEVSFFVGDDPAMWRTDLATFGEVTYRDLWPGIDMAVRGQAGTLKYEFLVQPGARLSDIGLAYRGANDLSLAPAGSLRVATPLGVLRDSRPVSYQQIDGTRVPVTSRYALEGNNGYGFAVGAYDHRYPLVIDPGLEYSSYLGGPSVSAACECGRGFEVDDEGLAYISGQALAGFPTTPGAFDATYGGGPVDAFLAIFDPSESGLDSLVYSTYIGGSETDASPGVAVIDEGLVAVGVGTNSPDFPVTPSAYQPVFGGGDFDAGLVVLDIEEQGSDALVYSTYFGGSGFDRGPAIAVGSEGDEDDGDEGSHVFLKTHTDSADLETTPDAFQTAYGGGTCGDFPCLDAFLAEFDISQSGPDSLDYATYFGGSGDDDREGLQVDQSGRVLMSGLTDSQDFPVTAGAYQPAKRGGFDAWVSVLDTSRPGAAGLRYSTYLGGDGDDTGQGVAAGPRGRVYLAGDTNSVDFPVTPGAFQPAYGGGARDAIVAVLDPRRAGASSLRYATYLGGSTTDLPNAISGDGTIDVDEDGRAFVAGRTNSLNFPVTADAFQPTYQSGGDGFATGIDPAVAGSAGLVYSTYLGGSTADRGTGIRVLDHSLFINGDTNSANFPVTDSAYDETYNGGSTDAFFTVLGFGDDDHDNEDA